MEPLPEFRYHPDPVATGSILAADGECRCCGQRRGFIYAGPVYGRGELRDALCPWCIASGAAAETFDAMFSDHHPLIQAGLTAEIVAEVTRRTPGFSSWQQEAWLVHCSDACAFRGDARTEDLRTDEARAQLADGEGTSPQQWAQFIEAYRPGGNPSVFLFQCNRCGLQRFQMDFK